MDIRPREAATLAAADGEAAEDAEVAAPVVCGALGDVELEQAVATKASVTKAARARIHRDMLSS